MTFDWNLYRGNLTWLPSHTVLMCRHGSHAYGTNIETSDEDFRGVAIPPAKYLLGALNRFEQAESKDPDLVVFDLRKFVSLASQCNPNVIEILFVDESDRLIEGAAGGELLDRRDWFLTKRVRHTFSGYAASQLKRIRTHYDWIRKGDTPKPLRTDFGLPDQTLVPSDQLKAISAEIQKKIDSWSADYLDGIPDAERLAVTKRVSDHLTEIGIANQNDLWLPAARTLGASDNLIEAMRRERAYTGALREWTNYQTWKANRNPARAALEQKSGYDTKHAMHLVRLLRMCREILTGQGVIVKRPDYAELLSIRNGAWTYEKLVDWATNEDAALQDIAAKSTLPKAPDLEKIDGWLVEVLRSYV